MKNALNMEVKFVGFGFFCVLVLALLCLLSTTASAAGMNAPVNNLWGNIDLPGFQFNYGTSSAGGKTNFDAGMTNSDRLSSVNVSISHDSTDPTRGWVNANFYGILGDQPVPMQYQSQSADINRHGVQYGYYISLGAYQEIVSWPTDKDGTPIYGDWLSTGNVSVTLFDVTPTWARCNYDEYLDEWSGTKYFSGNVNWEVEFNSTSYDSLGTVSSTVPEPCTMTVLASGALLLWRKRHR